MQAIIDFWNGLGPKIQLTVLGLTVMVAKDFLTFGKAKAEARREGRALPVFEWGIAVPTWWLGAMAGFGVGTGIDTLNG